MKKYLLPQMLLLPPQIYPAGYVPAVQKCLLWSKCYFLEWFFRLVETFWARKTDLLGRENWNNVHGAHERQNEPTALMTITNLALHNQTLYTMVARPPQGLRRIWTAFLSQK